jgi:hypothetical protein
MGNVFVQGDGGGTDAVEEEHVAFVRATGVVVEVLRVFAMTSQNLELVHLFEALQQGLFDLIFGDEVRHGG